MSKGFSVKNVQFMGGSQPSIACVTLAKDGKRLSDAAPGDNTSEAVFAAINRATGIACEDARIKQEPDGRTRVEISIAGQNFSGFGTGEEPAVASAHAYVAAINEFLGNNSRNMAR